VLANICFTQPLTKTVSKHVTGNHGYSKYNNLKFLFEAAKNIRFSHSNLFWGASLAPILPSFPLPPHVSVSCEENMRVWSPPPEIVYIFDAQLMTVFLEFSEAQ
jgi:hypothetical protein